MAKQQAETTDGVLLIAKIKPGQVDALRAVLAEVAKNMLDPEGPFAQIGTVHFLRLAILGDSYLLFASHFDGDFDAYIDDFFSFTSGGSNFDALLRYCEGWPGPNDREGFTDFWKSHKVEEFLFSSYPGVTCKEIEKALRIRHNLEAVLQDFQ